MNSTGYLICFIEEKIMEDGIGLLKVTVIQGNRLAIRDFKTSDPYVVLKLGNQARKTKIIDSCLDPVWNEEFTFSVIEPLDILKLEVFDYDRFKFDDKMGNAFLSIQPIVAASRLKHALNLSTGETKLRKVAPESDNCLMEDSFVTFANGEIVQNVRLRLHDVETGELRIKLQWVDCPSLSDQNPLPLPA